MLRWCLFSNGVTNASTALIFRPFDQLFLMAFLFHTYYWTVFSCKSWGKSIFCTDWPTCLDLLVGGFTLKGRFSHWKVLESVGNKLRLKMLISKQPTKTYLSLSLWATGLKTHPIAKTSCSTCIKLADIRKFLSHDNVGFNFPQGLHL